MSEHSVPPFGSRQAPRRLGNPRPRPPTAAAKSAASAVAGAVADVWRKLRGRKGEPEESPETSPTEPTAAGNAASRSAEPRVGLEAEAEAEVTAYLEGQGGALERAERLREKAERLEADGTPSESAQNRALRAMTEVEAGLAAFKARFVRSAGGPPAEAARAFDLALERRGLL